MGGQPSLDAERAAYADAFLAARESGDVDAMAAAALGLSSLQRFGDPAGRAPALLHQAYVAAADSPLLRARVAAGVARSSGYGKDAKSAAPVAPGGGGTGANVGGAPARRGAPGRQA